MIQIFATNLKKTTTITTPSKGGRLDTTLTDERVEYSPQRGERDGESVHDSYGDVGRSNCCNDATDEGVGNLKGVSRIVRFIYRTHGLTERLHAHGAREI